MAISSDKLREARDWVNLGLTLVTVLIIPTGLLVLRNQRLEMGAENARTYVSIEAWKANAANMAAENTALKTEIALLNVKIDKLQITLVRLADAVKLREP